jgi:diaminopimelate decarboxylase
MLNWVEADSIAQAHGDSFFIIDEALFKLNFQNLQAAFAAHYPDVRIGYSYKTNYTPHLCRIVDQLGGYAEVVSEMEYALARRIGVDVPRIVYNGPYKSKSTFRDAVIGGATVNLDSLRDVAMLKEVAVSHSTERYGVAIRCNFPLSDDDISRFGFDVDGDDFKLAIRTIAETPNLWLKGLHCHFPDRDLSSFGRRAKSMVDLVNSLFHGELPQVVNIGGGFASNMPASLRNKLGISPATFADYGALIGGILTKAFSGRGRMPTLFLEPGTALVADVMRFYARVISIKNVRGKKITTIAGSIFDISPYARSRNLPVSAINRRRGKRQVENTEIAGYTCIEADILSSKRRINLDVGDFVCYDNVGSYSIVMKPPFILPANPILVKQRDCYKVAKGRESIDCVFRDFVI